MKLRNNHEKAIEIVNEVATLATKLGIVHTETENESLDGRHVTINGQKLLFFGSCGYLGLEYDERLKAGAIEAVTRYGTQFSSSRAYASSRYYAESEELLSKMFNKPVVLLQSLTVGHMSNIPILVSDRDAVLLDAEVHDSVQTAVQLLKVRNIRVELIRHNRIDKLEEQICELKKNYEKIWFMCDGVYSMKGDFAPVKELHELLNRHEQLYLYVDDIHGMSWAGPNGTGYVLGEIPFHERLYLTTGLTKAFGVAGGLLVYPEEKTRQLIRNVGKAFIFSIQMPPMILGAVIASAKIHLSPEIYLLQNQLREKVEFFNRLAAKLRLPLIRESSSPIGFIGVGKPEVGYNMVRRLMKCGYYVNLSVFPSVSYNNTGLRIPINNKMTFEDIEGLLHTISEQLPFALKDTNQNMIEIYKSFKLVA